VTLAGYGKKHILSAEGFCPLRCGPDPMVSVDHGGKLSERIEVKKYFVTDKQNRQNPSRHSTSRSEFLPTPRKPADQGVFRIAGLGFFCYFSLPTKEK
jgi:hypothetical protein